MHFGWALGRPWLLVAFLVLASTAPCGAWAAALPRVAVVLSGPQALILQVQSELTLPLSAEAQIVQTSDYRRMAATIGILRHPRSNRAAPWVGRALGAQFVLIVDGLKQWGPSGVQSFIGVRLIGSAHGTVLHERRYFLPEGAVTPAIADSIMQQIVPMIRGGGPPAGLPLQPARPTLPHDSPALPPRGPPVRHPLLEPVPVPPKVQAATPAVRSWGPAPNGPLRPGRPAAKAQAKPRPGGQQPSVLPPLAFFVGPTLAWRRAHLSAVAPTGPDVPYGAGVGLGRPLVGASATVAGYRGRLGVEGTATFLYGKQSAQVGTASETGTVVETHLHLAAALALVRGPGVVLGRLGLAYDRMPVDVGPFVGLSFVSPTLGVHVWTPRYRNILALHAALDGVFFATAGLEAARAGAPTLSQGLKAMLRPELHLGRIFWALQLSVDYQTAHFNGPSALFSHNRYTAMALSDTHVAIGLSLGGTF